MADRPIHYSGGVLYLSGRVRRGCTTMLPGWPACTSGRRGEAISAAGEQSIDITQVTCPRCRDLWQRSRDDHAELTAHQRWFSARLGTRGPRGVQLATLGQMLTLPESSLRVTLDSPDHPDGGEREVVLTPEEAERIGRVLVAWGEARRG
ncbi:MAG: hypothetical protein EPO40_19780 [Myxococcaceae bacterium]|nr:MAG: hypothetical protein EPO40_19780 [Myxococcaceae bacterium]